MSEAPFTPAQVGRRLKVIRRAFALSQAQLATAIGVTPQAVGNWEQGRQRPAMDATERLVDTYGLTLDYVFLGRVGTLRHDLATRILDAERIETSASSDSAA